MGCKEFHIGFRLPGHFAGGGQLRIAVRKYFVCKYECDVTNGQVWWLILWICALHLTYPKCTDTPVNTHTVNTEQWAAIYALVPVEQLEVWYLAQGSHLSRGIKGGESAVHSPTIPAGPRLEHLQPLDYESNSLTIRPRLPQRKTCYVIITMLVQENGIRIPLCYLLAQILFFIKLFK